MLTSWDKLPDYMRIPELRPYYEILNKRRFSLFIKRLFDLFAAILLLVLLAIPMLVIAVWIKADSSGPVLYRQTRVTRDGKRFRIHKFRTMVENAEQLGSAITVGNDERITGAGRILRRTHLDEMPQLIDVICGDMSFVGTRPEAVKYVELYKPEYYATLLLPAGITSEASIRYKDEDLLLGDVDDVDSVYLEQVLPEKMKWNLEDIRSFSLLKELSTMLRTVGAVFGKDGE